MLRIIKKVDRRCSHLCATISISTSALFGKPETFTFDLAGYLSVKYDPYIPSTVARKLMATRYPRVWTTTETGLLQHSRGILQGPGCLLLNATGDVTGRRIDTDLPGEDRKITG